MRGKVGKIFGEKKFGWGILERNFGKNLRENFCEKNPARGGRKNIFGISPDLEIFFFEFGSVGFADGQQAPDDDVGFEVGERVDLALE